MQDYPIKPTKLSNIYVAFPRKPYPYSPSFFPKKTVALLLLLSSTLEGSKGRNLVTLKLHHPPSYGEWIWRTMAKFSLTVDKNTFLKGEGFFFSTTNELIFSLLLGSGIAHDIDEGKESGKLLEWDFYMTKSKELDSSYACSISFPCQRELQEHWWIDEACYNSLLQLNALSVSWRTVP